MALCQLVLAEAQLDVRTLAALAQCCRDAVLPLRPVLRDQKEVEDIRRPQMRDAEEYQERIYQELMARPGIDDSSDYSDEPESRSWSPVNASHRETEYVDSEPRVPAAGERPVGHLQWIHGRWVQGLFQTEWQRRWAGEY